ncbi:MAG: hypothetical protein HY720_04050 [Planctomycetes bacterium]|nr:hypothetical protein [Planctomycetota bacterium]
MTGKGTRAERRDPGAALVLVVAALSILAVLAIAMARLLAIERSAASSYSLAAQTRMAAAAGVEHAVAALRASAQVRSYDRPDEAWVYGGEDFDGDGKKSGLHEESFANNEFDRLECPLEYALRPSFPLLDPVTGWPVLSDNRGLSGSLAPAGQGSPRLAYAIRVLDAASQLDLNAGLGDPEYATNMAARTSLLWQEIVRGKPDAPVVPGIGEWLLAHRPPAGWSSEREVRDVLFALAPGEPGKGLEVFRRLSPYVACHPWRDRTVIRPRGKPRTPEKAGQPIEVETIASYEEIELATRAPVNVNTASTEVLFAALADISGWAYMDGILYHRNPQTGLEDLAKKKNTTDFQPDSYEKTTLDAELARKVAAGIVEHRRTVDPFKTSRDFRAFLDGLATNGTITRWQADLVEAQARPDTDINKFNPDAVLYKSIDKTDLIDYGTEFCFSSMGRFEIESLGLAFDRAGTLIGSSKIDATATVYDVLRDTTIEDFKAGEVYPTAGPSGRPAIEIYPEEERAFFKQYDGQLGLGTVRTQFATREPALDASFSPRDEAWSNFMEEGEGVELPIVGHLVGPPPWGRVFRGGAYSEDGRHPRFSTQKQYLSDTNGAIAFWYKPNWNMVSPAPRLHAIVDLNGEAADSTFQIYNDTSRPEGSDKGPGVPMLKFLGWDLGNNREAKIEIPLEGITEAREWVHVWLQWGGRYVTMSVQGREETVRWAQIHFVSGGWSRAGMSYSSPMGVYYWGGTWGFRSGPTGPETVDNYDPNLQPPWREERRFASLKDLEAWLGSLCTDTTPADCPYPAGHSWCPYMDWTNYGEARQDLYKDPGARTREQGASEYLAEHVIRFGFTSDTTAALRFGGRLKIATEPSSEPDKPPHYNRVKAPSNGTYGELLAVNDIPEGDATLDSDLRDLWVQGRYYKSGDAYFESKDLGVPAGTRLGTISWEVHQPPLLETGVELEILGKPPFSASGECALGGTAPGGPLKYRALFLASAQADLPLIETPYIDSVTVTVLGPVRFERWDEDLGAPAAPWAK